MRIFVLPELRKRVQIVKKAVYGEFEYNCAVSQNTKKQKIVGNGFTSRPLRANSTKSAFHTEKRKTIRDKRQKAN